MLRFEIVVGSWYGEWERNEEAPTFDQVEDALEWIKENRKDYVFNYHGGKREHSLMILPIFDEEVSLYSAKPKGGKNDD